jgi:hypothetical protein
MKRSREFQRCEAKCQAILKVMDWLDVSRYAFTDATDATTDQVDAEVRDAMQAANIAIGDVMMNLAIPIMQTLPKDVREAVEKAF